MRSSPTRMNIFYIPSVTIECAHHERNYQPQILFRFWIQLAAHQIHWRQSKVQSETPIWVVLFSSFRCCFENQRHCSHNPLSMFHSALQQMMFPQATSHGVSALFKLAIVRYLIYPHRPILRDWNERGTTLKHNFSLKPCCTVLFASKSEHLNFYTARVQTISECEIPWLSIGCLWEVQEEF